MRKMLAVLALLAAACGPSKDDVTKWSLECSFQYKYNSMGWRNCLQSYDPKAYQVYRECGALCELQGGGLSDRYLDRYR